jgi:hypothetical protein
MTYNNSANINDTGIINADGAGSFNGTNLDATGNTISSTNTNGDIVIAPDGTGTVSITAAPIVPSGDRADSLGSATNSWDNVYADGLTFDDGSNIMSVYEAGTWTPALNFNGGTTGITYSTQTGTYLRIGNLIQYNIAIVLTSKGTDTGLAQITGLSITPGDNSYGCLKYQKVTYSGVSVVALLRNSGGFNMLFQSLISAGAGSNLTDTNFANDTKLNISGTFTV